ncbi:hypothetical protein L7F22_014449 [Adiantum nelumboides]|nr:hypothetical protein [Adiantum nelumboides]
MAWDPTSATHPRRRRRPRSRRQGSRRQGRGTDTRSWSSRAPRHTTDGATLSSVIRAGESGSRSAGRREQGSVRREVGALRARGGRHGRTQQQWRGPGLPRRRNGAQGQHLPQRVCAPAACRCERRGKGERDCRAGRGDIWRSWCLWRRALPHEGWPAVHQRDCAPASQLGPLHHRGDRDEPV